MLTLQLDNFVPDAVFVSTCYFNMLTELYFVFLQKFPHNKILFFPFQKNQFELEFMYEYSQHVKVSFVNRVFSDRSIFLCYKRR